ncbi:MAG: hypothetical protein EWM72_01720 [Nitrospira sp.]|nr:MAG: hypothetical protein EWM72_01720 [Nitrospira sp.]
MGNCRDCGGARTEGSLHQARLRNIIDDILTLLNKEGLTSRQSLNLLEQLSGIIEMGQWLKILSLALVTLWGFLPLVNLLVRSGNIPSFIGSIPAIS